MCSGLASGGTRPWIEVERRARSHTLITDCIPAWKGVHKKNDQPPFGGGVCDTFTLLVCYAMVQYASGTESHGTPSVQISKDPEFSAYSTSSQLRYW